MPWSPEVTLDHTRSPKVIGVHVRSQCTPHLKSYAEPAHTSPRAPLAGPLAALGATAQLAAEADTNSVHGRPPIAALHRPRPRPRLATPSAAHPQHTRPAFTISESLSIHTVPAVRTKERMSKRTTERPRATLRDPMRLFAVLCDPMRPCADPCGSVRSCAACVTSDDVYQR